MELSDDELRRFADACGDSSNTAARSAMLAAGASTASGVLAKIVLAPHDEQRRLLDLIRAAIRNSARR